MTNSYLWVLAGIAKAAFNEPCGLTVSVPPDKVNVDNLTKLLDAKGDLIRKAPGVGALPVEVGEDAVSFPRFDERTDTFTVNAYTHFISALCLRGSTSATRREYQCVNSTHHRISTVIKGHPGNPGAAFASHTQMISDRTISSARLRGA